MAKFNPFAPNSPIHPGMFVGRVDEIVKLESYLVQTKNENPVSFMITGERGIGKSSLLNYIKAVAEGLEGVDETRVSFLAIDTDIDWNTTQLGLVEKIKLALERALGQTEKARDFLTQSWVFEARGSGRLQQACSGYGHRRKWLFDLRVNFGKSGLVARHPLRIHPMWGPVKCLG